MVRTKAGTHFMHAYLDSPPLQACKPTTTSVAFQCPAAGVLAPCSLQADSPPACHAIFMLSQARGCSGLIHGSFWRLP